MTAIDFVVARTKQIICSGRLRAFLDGREGLTEAQAISHQECHLGKWLYSEGIKKYGTIPEMQVLEKVHSDLHGTVQRIVELKRTGNSSAAEKEDAKVKTISQDIISLLNAIEQKVKGHA